MLGKLCRLEKQCGLPRDSDPRLPRIELQYSDGNHWTLLEVYLKTCDGASAG